jgi:hypothetical protein
LLENNLTGKDAVFIVRARRAQGSEMTRTQQQHGTAVTKAENIVHIN